MVDCVELMALNQIRLNYFYQLSQNDILIYTEFKYVQESINLNLKWTTHMKLFKFYWDKFMNSLI